MIRIGQSIDIHRLIKGRKLILGGVDIAFYKGLEGHSDADCVLHSISESIIGALSLGDLGDHFPDNDISNKNIDSRLILTYCKNLLEKYNYVIQNLDCIILCEQPNLSSYKSIMKKNIANILNINFNKVNVKATTGEKIGIIGTGKAIACESVILICKKNSSIIDNKHY